MASSTSIANVSNKYQLSMACEAQRDNSQYVNTRNSLREQLASAYGIPPTTTVSEAFSRLKTLVERQKQPATPSDRAQQDRPPQRDGVVLPRLA